MILFTKVVSTNIKPHLSGVAKFGYLLAKKLQIPFCSFFDLHQLTKSDNLFLSITCDDLPIELENQIWRLISLAKEKKASYSIFFHSWAGNSLEHELIKNAKKIYAANTEIGHEIKKVVDKVTVLWAPSLLEGVGLKNGRKMHIFSFGMAFKIQTHYHKILAKKLREYNVSYIIRFSTGFHEKANFGNYDDYATELEEIYGDNIQFFGFLSDDAVDYFIRSSDLYVNFFPKGARSNNTTIFAPMMRNCPVLSNLDALSPEWMEHGKNILDILNIRKSHFSTNKLRNISQIAKADVERYTRWSKLISILKAKNK